MDTKRKNRIMFGIYILFMAITLITEIVSFSVFENRDHSKKDIADFTSGWVDEDGSEAVLSGISGKYTITNTLPDTETDRMVYIHVKSADISVYIGGRCVYSSVEYDEKFFGKTAGSYFVRVPVHVSDSGSEIRLCIDNPYEDGGGKLTKIYFGTGSDIIMSEVGQMLPGFIVCMFITFLGVLFLVMFIPMWRNKTVGIELLYFALFTINIGMFMLTDSKFLHSIYPDPHFYHMVTEIHMLLIVIPLFLFLNKMYSTCSELMVYCMGLMGIFNFVICYVLNITCTMDYHQSLWITHTTYGVAILFAVIVVVKGMIIDIRAHMYHNIGLLIMCVAAVADIVIIKFSNAFETSFFTRLGVLVYICLEGIQIFMGFFVRYREGMKAKLLSSLAYHDGLTELLNRTSFMEDIEKLDRQRDSGTLIAMFDVNDLKKANDNYGHAVGDKMIVTVADKLKKYLGEYGKCYRIGGDEFVFISDNTCDRETFTNAVDVIRQELFCAEEEGKFVFPITMAAGFSVLNRSFPDVKSAIDEADAKMYDDKKQMKLARQLTVDSLSQLTVDSLSQLTVDK